MPYHWWSVCTNAHSQVYNERAFNGFSLYFTVCTYLIAPHMCVLLNIIFNPHLFEKLSYATIFFALYKSVHCHFRCKIDFFFHCDCVTLFQFMNTKKNYKFFWQLFKYFFSCLQLSCIDASRFLYENIITLYNYLLQESFEAIDFSTYQLLSFISAKIYYKVNNTPHFY